MGFCRWACQLEERHKQVDANSCQNANGDTEHDPFELLALDWAVCLSVTVDLGVDACAQDCQQGEQVYQCCVPAAVKDVDWERVPDGGNHQPYKPEACNIEHPPFLDLPVREEIAGERKPHEDHGDDETHRNFETGNCRHFLKRTECIRSLTDQRERDEQCQPIIRLIPCDDQPCNRESDCQQYHQHSLIRGVKRCA